MITTQELLELGFQGLEGILERFNGQKLTVYDENTNVRCVELYTNYYPDSKDNEWSVVTPTRYSLLEFTDFEQLKAYIKLVKGSVMKNSLISEYTVSYINNDFKEYQDGVSLLDTKIFIDATSSGIPEVSSDY